MQAALRYIPRNEIDVSKWDRCIHNAPNGLIYAYSFYLDHMAKNWDALVLEDYEAVMPVTWNKKYGIRYLYQPPFCAELGIFGKNLSENLLQNYLQQILSVSKLIEIDMNFGNMLLHPPVFSIMRSNYVLDLQRPYEEIIKNYRENIRRNIRKSQQLNCRYTPDVPVDDVIQLSREQMSKISNVTGSDYKRFKELFLLLQSKGEALSYGVYSQNNELIASSIFFFSHKRAYYILVGNHPNGKTVGASHYLIDRFIYDHAGKELLLDFEGSDVRNLAFFYSSFGSHIEKYPGLRVNRLPWWIRWMKR